MKCIHCEEPVTVIDGRLCSGESAVVNHGADGSCGRWVFPPDPHCYWSPDGRHAA